MVAQHFIVATAGHVDHGKSALVKALTGTDPDRLPEEKARGITIDLGFAHLELPAPGPAPDASRAAHPASRYHVGIVDVPGHEDFVKNMVAGVGSIDLALFVVAADDGWMPQTEEHLQILSYLGVTRAVIALTKIDLAPDEEAAVAALREKLHGSPFAQAPIVKTSIVNHRGIEELKLTLARALGETPPPQDIGKPRLPVDRVFILHGIGTVITGTLSGGQLRRGQAVVIQPSGRATRIRSVQSYNRDVEVAEPGARTALNLPDVEIGSRGHASSAGNGIQRGHVITLPDFGAACDTVDVLIEKSPRLVNTSSAAGRPLKDGARVRLHHGSGNVAARVSLADAGALLPGERLLAQLRCSAPLFAFAGDHFIVRDASEQCTLAGGVILEPDANRKHFRRQAHRNFLERRSQGPAEAYAFAASCLTRDRAMRARGLLLKTRFGQQEFSAAIERLKSEGLATQAGEWVADAKWWQGICQKASEAIRAAHRAQSERLGFPLSELRRAVEADLPEPAIFDSLLNELGRTGFIQEGASIRHQSHRPALPPHLQSAGAKLRAALSAKPLEPPSRKELAPDNVSQQALRFLLETGQVMELGGEIVLLSDHFNQAAEKIRSYLRERGSATVSDLRQALATSRRIMVPLLERLDRDGITLRQGDKRILRK